jgi:hypothetical protein
MFALSIASVALLGMIVFARWGMTHRGVSEPQGIDADSTVEGNSYSITRVIPSSLLKKFKKEEDVYD